MLWKLLQMSPSAGAQLPPLLVSATLNPSSYHIQLTDLTHIWSESLSKKQIIRRSQEENTSIDPSNADQFQIFLEKLHNGVTGCRDTTLSLTINADTDRPSLTLHITVNLPGGLAPLQWPVKLAASPASQLTSELVVPLLKAQQERLQELASLTEVLREKDHVIQKLMDKLEDQGTELGTIFPQAAGKAGRKVNRLQAEERVRGLGSFSMKDWTDDLSGPREAQSLTDLLGEVFQGESAREVTRSSLPLEADDWFEDVKGITVNLQSGKISTKGVSRASSNVPQKTLNEEESTDDDDFQVQATPPGLTKAAPETTDDEDRHAPTQPSKISDSIPVTQSPLSPPPKSGRKLGTIGRKKEFPEPELAAEDETASEDEVPQPSSIPRERTPTPVSSPAKPKRKLGKIGGRKRTPTPEPEPEPEPFSEPEPASAKPKKARLGTIRGKKKQPSPDPEPEPEEATSSPEPPRHKLGTIGHRGKSQTTPVKEERGRTPKIESPPKPRETSEERANNKRAQLKRELEEKAKAPAKKKKKF